MRRKLAYIILNLAVLLGAGAAIGESITKMDTDVNYGDGKDLYFRLSEENSTLNGIFPENYLGSKSETQNYETINSVATEMEERLAHWGVNGTVAKEGYDLIKVTLRVEGDSDTEYNYLQNYLAFSGGDITVAAGTTDDEIQKNAPTGDNYLNNAMFKGQTASIEYINDSVPVVTIPVNYEGKDGPMGELINYCSENTKTADSSAGTEEKNCYLVLWANWQEGDSYKLATSTDAETKNSNMAKRLIFGENASNAWYTDTSNDDNNYKKLQLVPNSEAIQDGQYDSSKSGAAYKAAFYYMSLLNASSYGDDFHCDVNFIYSHRSTALVDPLIEKGSWHLSPHFGPTLISSLVALALLALLSALFYRIGALSVVSNVLIAAFASFSLFAYFHAAFGIGAVVGFALGALLTAFGSIYYFAKFKEQLYEGRSPKKAHQEAIKKALWPTVDIGVLGIIIGLCVYGFVPATIGVMGLSLILSSFFGTLANLLLLRLEGYLLANDNQTEAHLASLYGVDVKKIPNALQEEKQTYFGPYAKTDFAKHKTVFGIVAGVLLLASVIGVSVWSALGNGYNYADAYDDTTSLSLEYRVREGQSTAEFSKIEDIETKFLPLLSYEEQTFDNYVKEDGIVVESATIYDSDTASGEQEAYTVYYFHIDLNRYFAPDTDYVFLVNGVSETDLLTNVVAKLADDCGMEVGVANNVTVQAGVPTLGTIYLSLGVASLASLAYLFLRHRPSRALAASLISLGSSVFVAGLYSLTRIAITPVANIALIAVFFAALLLSSYILNKEKEIRKESREHEKESASFRDACLLRANSEAAGDLIIFAIVIFGILLAFMALGPATYYPIFLGAIVGLLFVTFLSLCALTPLATLLSKWLRLAKNSIAESRKKNKESKPNSGNLPSSRRRAEPEEAIFIGIND